MAPNHVGETLRSILGPMGSHWGQKMAQNHKKLPCPKIRIFDYSAEIDLCKKSNLPLRRQITVGNPWGPSWGQKGPIGAKKWVKNYLSPIFEFLTTPRSSLWAKNRIDGYGAKSRWGSPRVHFGPMGSHWGQKMGQNRKKLPCPKIRIFDYSAVIDLCKKSNLRLRRQITMGNPWGPSWGQWGPIGAKKWVKTVKNCHAPKFEFLTSPRSSIWAKNRIYGYGTKSRWGPPRIHLGVNGVPLGPKNGWKP